MSIHAHADHEAAIKHAEHVSAKRERIGLTALSDRERAMIAGGFEEGASYGRKQAVPQGEREILASLQAYFPQAETLHDCYRGIEALEERAHGAATECTWSGAGLPPAGSIIEFRYQNSPRWSVASVCYASSAYLILLEDGSAVEQHYNTSSLEIRPARNAAQIAEQWAVDERSRVICDMASVVGAPMSPMTIPQALVALCDAGFRRKEGRE